jgi:hypothetical protein
MHKQKCTKAPKQLTELDPEWMDKDQDRAYWALDCRRERGTPLESFQEIYRRLWPETRDDDIPEPC